MDGGRVIIVTGGSSGIGLCTVERLVADGCRVATCARDGARLRAATAHLGSAVVPVACDVLDERMVNAFVYDVASRFGRIDGLVANAGEGRRGPPLATSTAEWRGELTAKVASVLNPVRAAAAHLKRTDAPRIVVVSSVNAREPDAELAASSAGRAAVASLARTLATELAPDGILVNTVAVGLIDTPRQRRVHERSGSTLSYEGWLKGEVERRGVLLGRPGTPQEVAHQIVGLLSPLTSYTTGATIDVAGGSRRGS